MSMCELWRQDGRGSVGGEALSFHLDVLSFWYSRSTGRGECLAGGSLAALELGIGA